MTTQRRLGRGLEALLGRPAAVEEQATLAFHDPQAVAELASTPGTGLLQLDVNTIDANRFQPRQDFDEDELEALAESIRQHGLIQPIVVRRQGDRYELISGERRLRAAIKAGWSEVPAQLREADDRQVAEIAIVENVQRKDLSPLEKAASFQRYLDDYHCTQEELASRIQIDRSTIANLIRLLELPGTVQQCLREGAITQGHARALLPLGDEEEQLRFCREIVAKQLSVRATEDAVQDAIRQADAEPLVIAGRTGSAAKRRRPSRGHLATLEQEIRKALGAKVEIRQAAKGRGRIVVHFATAEEFERLHQHLCSRGDYSGQAEAG
ncbi:MAG: ParB/RepB/Spo0J family partition protein [Pirellulales bacterium]